MIEDTYKITTVEMISAFPPGVAYSPADINCCLFLIYGLYLANPPERILDEHPVYAVDHPVFPYALRYPVISRSTVQKSAIIVSIIGCWNFENREEVD